MSLSESRKEQFRRAVAQVSGQEQVRKDLSSLTIERE